MENIKKSEKSFKAATFCFVLSVIVLIISIVSVIVAYQSQYRYYQSVLNMLIYKLSAFVIITAAIQIIFLIKIRKGSSNAWIMLLTFLILVFVWQIFVLKFVSYYLFGYASSILFLVFSKQGLDALKHERNEQWDQKGQDKTGVELQREQIKNELREELKQEIKEELKAELKKKIQDESNN